MTNGHSYSAAAPITQDSDEKEVLKDEISQTGNEVSESQCSDSSTKTAKSEAASQNDEANPSSDS